MAKVYVFSYIGLSDNDPDGNGYNEVSCFKTFEDARKFMKSSIENEKENILQMEEDCKIIVDKDDEFWIEWCGGSEQVRMCIYEVPIR